MRSGTEVVFIDSSVLISCGRQERRLQALAREARQRDTVFCISPQVYAEVTGNPALKEYTTTDTVVEEALQEGWMKVTESPSYSTTEVSNVMDQTRSYIASATGRTEDTVEKADAEIVGLALETLLEGTADRVTIVTNDIPLGEAAESIIPQYGYDREQITWCTGSELADELDEDFVSAFD